MPAIYNYKSVNKFLHTGTNTNAKILAQVIAEGWTDVIQGLKPSRKELKKPSCKGEKNVTKKTPSFK